jgi:Caspase domain
MARLARSAVAMLFGSALAVLLADSALADRRVALVISNAAYQNAPPLTNTPNDAKAMAEMFAKAGFDVVEKRNDVGVLEFKRALREFMAAARSADIAVFYFAGHGIEAAGTNYLIPIDAKLASDYDAEDEAVSLDRIMLALEPARRLRLIVLDACRDNPFVHHVQRAIATRAVPAGLAKVEPESTDTLIAYAAKAGSTSLDGTGPNSPFTAALLKYLPEPGLDVRIALGRVRDEVLKNTGGRQEPFVYGSLGGSTIALVPAPEAAKTPPPMDQHLGAERDYEMAERIGTRQAFQSFLKAHDSGFYADLARAQLEKLGKPRTSPAASEPAAKPPAAEKNAADETTPKDRTKEPDRLAVQQPHEEERRAKAEPERRPEPAHPSMAKPGSDSGCARDEERLSRLRAEPDADEIAEFARHLSCEALRPQVARLLESVSPLPAKTAVPTPIAPAPRPAAEPARPTNLPQQPGSVPAPRQTNVDPAAENPACKREEQRLVRLRAARDREEVARFARELACEELRPQVVRLLESLAE